MVRHHGKSWRGVAWGHAGSRTAQADSLAANAGLVPAPGGGGPQKISQVGISQLQVDNLALMLSC
jgi:hypothetical protein